MRYMHTALPLDYDMLENIYVLVNLLLEVVSRHRIITAYYLCAQQKNCFYLRH